MSAPWVSISAAALLTVTMYMGPTSANVKMDTTVTDRAACVSNAGLLALHSSRELDCTRGVIGGVKDHD